jgi:hypothetical protein
MRKRSLRGMPVPTGCSLQTLWRHRTGWLTEEVVALGNDVTIITRSHCSPGSHSPSNLSKNVDPTF